jgi:epoxyqueuosine reductase QueG
MSRDALHGKERDPMEDTITGTHDPAALVRNACTKLDIPLVGFAPADRWEDPQFSSLVPPSFRPKSIIPETQNVIVIGLPVHLPVLDTAPSIFYHELYKTVNSLLDGHAYRIAEALNTEGHASTAIPRDGYGSIGVIKEKPIAFFSHRHAAYLAGLGTFGVNNMVLTPEYGPRIRFTSIFTTAQLPPSQVMTESQCIHCMKCVDACPANALLPLDYPEGITEKKSCATRAEQLFHRHISPCGLCIRVCPVGDDRKLYGREDTDIYDEKDDRFRSLHAAWTHVRSYGSR